MVGDDHWDISGSHGHSMPKAPNDLLTTEVMPENDSVFNALPTSRVIFMVKTSLDLFSLGQKQVWTYAFDGEYREAEGM